MLFEIYDLGDRGITFQHSDPPSPESHAHLRRMKSWFDNHTFPGLQDVVLSYKSLTLLIDRFALHQSGVKNIDAFLREHFLSANNNSLQEDEGRNKRVTNIPVCYDPLFGFDLETISDQRKISPAEIIRLHTSIDYNVYMIGFLPGFPYLGFVDDRISVARKSAPIAKVPAGSVGIAGRQTGIYPLDSPGGWQIIGRTPWKLFDANRTPPVELQPGDTVRFYEISYAEFTKLLQPS